MTFASFVDSIRPRRVFRFWDSRLLPSTEDHFFVCVGVGEDNDLILVLCCSSQITKRRDFIQSRGIPETTLVEIKPSPVYIDLTKITVINCNEIWQFSVDQFTELFRNKKISACFELEPKDFELVVTGIHDSPEISSDEKELLDNMLLYDSNN